MDENIVIIGPGSISRKYIEAVNSIEDMSVVGVVGRNRDKTELYAREHGIPFAGINLKTVCRDSNANSIIVCTPNGAHREGVIRGAELGMNVLCEKPFGITTFEQEEMINICEKYGVTLEIGYSYRFLPHVKKLKTLIDKGVLGRILVIDVDLAVWRESNYFSNSTWHGTWELDGGGAFIQQGSHLLDIALWFGNGFDKVLGAHMFTLLQPIEVEDHGYAVIHYKNGAVGSVTCSTVRKGLNSNKVTITGTLGSVVFDFEGIRQWKVESEKPPVFPALENTKIYIIRELLLDFHKAVETGHTPFITAESASIVTELVMEIYKKSKENVNKNGDKSTCPESHYLWSVYSSAE